jgi:hypothetical protein
MGKAKEVLKKLGNVEEASDEDFASETNLKARNAVVAHMKALNELDSKKFSKELKELRKALNTLDVIIKKV